ncbi:helix-turn-helix domain-containing protein [Serratia odorifera]|jgi:transcriptional regulator with XRE-family HTH domain|uniref:DNA-binding helix-turn-helix protein n=2 Tax=Serratia odorifera TaxID=618 RepID=D4E0X5_SEROD|nr:helix-turn-helix domain-containing protein [Serratia odorifera]EFE96578.1 DNA-binding helix-turn-helix protein [Serratia odorifera DSM 4582]PNK90942.1 XRE family transcriptional regulator [Serratia odorifera]RII72237.1 XRE family transcriptional regulator [Serratia odorifera]VDZ57491.1 HTH-type transcriptional regulator sinR [Serratia odorifera]HEJ9096120.1 helix-turn-helix domain-containing protein [Serratia odorifera]
MTKKVNKTTEAGADMQHVSEAVSKSISDYRKGQKLSLDELARRAGVSKGMLVEIEKGSANPSIAILCKIAAALGLSVADIVNVTHAPDSWRVDKQDIPTLWHGEKGGSARLLAGTSGPNMIELWRWEMFPGEVFSSPGHPQGTLELLHVETGVLDLATEATTLRVTEGCSAVARTDSAHHYANAGNSPLVFTMTVAEFHR